MKDFSKKLYNELFDVILEQCRVKKDDRFAKLLADIEKRFDSAHSTSELYQAAATECTRFSLFTSRFRSAAEYNFRCAIKKVILSLSKENWIEEHVKDLKAMLDNPSDEIKTAPVPQVLGNGASIDEKLIYLIAAVEASKKAIADLQDSLAKEKVITTQLKIQNEELILVIKSFEDEYTSRRGSNNQEQKYQQSSQGHSSSMPRFSL